MGDLNPEHGQHVSLTSFTLFDFPESEAISILIICELAYKSQLFIALLPSYHINDYPDLVSPHIECAGIGRQRSLLTANDRFNILMLV